jgi:CubicO group peptidase (beta-lactamase class C family)
MHAHIPPESVGLDPSRWQAVCRLVEDCCSRDLLTGATVVAGRSGGSTETYAFGRLSPAPGSVPMPADAIFLTASIAKPIVAMGTLLLLERGQIRLDDRVHEHVPQFGGAGRYGIAIRHLLTHTSGLPDMPPNNRALREAHAPFAKFIEEICTLKPSFLPGKGVRYQSTGFALLGEIISRVSGRDYKQFLREELFEPLGMHDTSLGTPEEWYSGPASKASRFADLRATKGEAGAAEWGWNSRYWRGFGSPWGGVMSTAGDLAKFAEMLLAGGKAGGRQLLSPAVIEAAARNQLAAMPDVPEEDRRCRPWGLGWRLNWPGHPDTFGDLLGPNVYGHWGATGTLLWIDPDSDAYAVVLTNEPKDVCASLLVRLSNAIAGAFV